MIGQCHRQCTNIELALGQCVQGVNTRGEGRRPSQVVAGFVPREVYNTVRLC